jgi:formate hydrogenlyase subunit 3/multisubunit Na+/H+ antiporter MnhD subunit
MRQMGGAYLYSFDIAAMLFGVCFNLAGLPYSAGFLGKEFLLFQVLRDDFLSLFVRGCWLVSFFFTPIYMLMLVFLVMFGPKKGSVIAYRSGWHVHMTTQLYSLISYAKLNRGFSQLFKTSTYRFTFTTITSRTTSYFLFSFWCFFFFLAKAYC